jgi:restriction system protein
MAETKIPSYDALMTPLVRALNALGGSGSVEEILAKVVDLERFPDKMLTHLHDEKRSYQTELDYRLSWARSYLKKFGMLENSSRGVWALTDKAKGVEQVDSKEVVRVVRAMGKRRPTAPDAVEPGESDEDVVDAESPPWKQQLHALLTTKISPAAFERLVQRLLRESGFTQVVVTGRSGDGGIDGRGIARIHGLMSFHVYFQCKRYKGAVSPSEVRDFRGAMAGRADKGLLITTGTFSPSAVKEATRDGPSPIDLVDGVELADKLKEFGLGVRSETRIVLDEQWFNSL